jgi:hypothetical protein
MDSLYDDDSDSDDDRDDLQQYLSTDRRKTPAGEVYFNPIEWWIEKKADWPSLSRGDPIRCPIRTLPGGKFRWRRASAHCI